MDESSPIIHIPGEPVPDQPEPATLLDYARLLRIPNVFTAMADIFLGFLFTHQSFQPLPLFLTLLLSSSLMYMAGMVLNDVYDLEIDKVERPERPLPSGVIDVRWAHTLGLTLLFLGLLTGVGAGVAIGSLRPAMVATALALLVFAYDRVLKKTPLGPLAMGGCRMLNVLLGMSTLSGEWGLVHVVVAGGLGLYIAGVTWFAKSEAEESNRAVLSLATVVILLGIALLAMFPEFMPPVDRDLLRWRMLLGVVAFFVGLRLVAAILDPSPGRVQVAIKNCLLSLVVLDAAVAVVVCPLAFGVAILALLAPAMILGRWVYST